MDRGPAARYARRTAAARARRAPAASSDSTSDAEGASGSSPPSCATRTSPNASSFDRRTRRALGALEHPSSPTQLRPLLGDPERSWAVRQVAVTIAGACPVGQPRAICLPWASTSTRARVSSAPGGRSARRVRGPRRDGRSCRSPRRAAGDASDEIKGQALKAVCPGVVPVTEVLAGLTPLKDRHLIGMYRMFLRQT